jgi:hypothetical protein
MFNTEIEFKGAVSNLRKALREHYGKNVPSHTQCLELMATTLGATSYAQLRTRWSEPSTAQGVQVTTSATATAPATPVKEASERLRNDKGQFDVVSPDGGGDDEDEEDGSLVVYGRDFSEVEGTVEDILYCVASARRGHRENGKLVPHYEGDTDVNWDGQETRCNQRGETLWEGEAWSEIPSSELILVPEDFNAEADPDDEGNWPWPVREALVEAYVAYAKRYDLVKALIAGQEAFLDLEDETLGRIADALGFAMHYGELETLIERLKEI